MQRFRVVYHGIPHESLVFSRYTRHTSRPLIILEPSCQKWFEDNYKTRFRSHCISPSNKALAFCLFDGVHAAFCGTHHHGSHYINFCARWCCAYMCLSSLMNAKFNTTLVSPQGFLDHGILRPPFLHFFLEIGPPLPRSLHIDFLR